MKIVTIFDSNSPLLKILEKQGLSYFPFFKDAFHESINYLQSEWVSRIRNCGANKGWKNRYVESIKTLIKDNGNDLSGEVSSGGLYTNLVEDGIRSYDMKPGLLASKYAKTNRKGEKYLIVFFRKLVKQIPKEVMKQLKKLDYNKPIEGFEDTGKRTKLDSGYTWKSGEYQGMQKRNRAGHTNYGTFRVVSARSNGWIYPEVKGYKIFNTLDSLFPEVINKLRDGILEDLSIKRIE